MWLLFALVGFVFWSLENVGIKYVIGDRIKNPYVFNILFTFGTAVIFLLIPFIDFYIPNANLLLVIFFASFFYFFGGFPYVKALEIEEVTRVNLYWNIIPIISLVIGWMFLGDNLSVREMVGLVVILLGTVLTSLKFRYNQSKVSTKPFWLMLLACLSFAIYSAIIRYVTRFMPGLVVAVWLIIFDCLLSSLFFLSVRFRKIAKDAVAGNGKYLVRAIIGLSVLAVLGIIFNQKALALKPAALVFSLEGFQILLVFVWAMILNRKNPQAMREDFSGRNLIVKLIALALMIVGLWIIN